MEAFKIQGPTPTQTPCILNYDNAEKLKKKDIGLTNKS